MVPSTHLVGVMKGPAQSLGGGRQQVMPCEPAQPAPLSREDQEGQEEAG